MVQKKVGWIYAHPTFCYESTASTLLTCGSFIGRPAGQPISQGINATDKVDRCEETIVGRRGYRYCTVNSRRIRLGREVGRRLTVGSHEHGIDFSIVERWHSRPRRFIKAIRSPFLAIVINLKVARCAIDLVVVEDGVLYRQFTAVSQLD